MFAVFLSVDDTTAERSRDASLLRGDYVNPTWERIEFALRTMDGLRRNTVIVSNSDNPGERSEKYLGVSGGDNNVYIYSYCSSDGEYSLNDSSRPNEFLKVLSGEERGLRNWDRATWSAVDRPAGLLATVIRNVSDNRLAKSRLRHVSSANLPAMAN